MQKSESIAALAAALAKAQGEMCSAKHDRDNPFFKSRYATLAAVMEAARPIHVHGLAIVQTAEVDRTESGTAVVVDTMLTHASGEWISSSLRLRPTKDDPQGIGSAITYARRYSAAAIIGLASEEDDDDGNAASGKPAQKPQPKPPAPATKKEDPKPEPKKEPAPPPAPKSDGTTGGDMAAAIKQAREAAISAGYKGREEVFASSLWSAKGKFRIGPNALPSNWARLRSDSTA